MPLQRAGSVVRHGTGRGTNKVTLQKRFVSRFFSKLLFQREISSIEHDAILGCFEKVPS